MKTLSSLYCIIASMLTMTIITGCDTVTPLADYGKSFPATTTNHMRSAIMEALTTERWIILAEAPNYFQAQKTAGDKTATIYIAYGYRGYDIEYAFGQNMQYNPAQNTISSRYTHWETELAREINDNLR